MFMHNVHFISTPIYIYILITLFKNKNISSEFYVTFMWLPVTYLPYEVYRTTGWLSRWGVSGLFQFYILTQFVIVIGVSILEMFHFRFIAVVVHHTGGLLMKLPSYGLYVFRGLAVTQVITVAWSTFDGRTLVYQQNRKGALFQKDVNVPKEIGCYTVFIFTPEDPILITNLAIYGVLVFLGLIVALSTVYLINRFLNRAHNLSQETKRLQKMLIVSLFGQSAIHVIMIAFPASYKFIN
ncbi:hypothetical protein CRE_16097 [Caenorhabditis remanei]|uniref:G protein-coupled receptor n=1 Tax=Caenorhabditis remanei TaxID=31234 RepID=E3MBT7_CAERE|nr:hypothetical protein CRE_16097 [Caenorhabditis remanei]